MKKFPLKQILVLLVGIAVLAGFILLDSDVRQIDDVLAAMSPWWLLGAFFCVCLYCLGDTVMYLIACRDMEIPQPLGEGLLTTMIGFFYSAITPLASGGQPFQVLQMRNRGIRVGTATSVLMVKFLGWHVSITTLGLVAFLLRGGRLLAVSTTMFVLFIVGFFVHAFCVFVGIMLMIRPVWIERAGHAVVSWVGARFIRKPGKADRMHAAWQKFVDDYRQAVAFARAHAGGMLLVLLTGLVEVAAYMSVTYFVYRGLGFQSESYLTLVAMQTMLSIAVAFMPLPGASGASEGGFYAIFTVFFDGARLAGMLIWRVMTYYFMILFGLIAVIVDSFREKKRGEPAPPEA